MKKIIICLLLIFLYSCTSIEKDSFTPVSKLMTEGFCFEEGDILILRKKMNLYSRFGHCALVLEGGRVAEYPAYGYGYMESNLSDWLEYCSSRDIIVLRADLTEEQKEEFRDLVQNYSYSKYGAFNKKFTTKEFYCSSYIWRIYYEMGIDLNEDFKFFIFPYDFVKSRYLKQIKMQEN